jgi:hypothetical protein
VRSNFFRNTRWYRSAQPPANGFEPSGFTEARMKVALCQLCPGYGGVSS